MNENNELKKEKVTNSNKADRNINILISRLENNIRQKELEI